MLISSITYRDLFIYIFGRCVHCIGMQHVSITRRLQWNIYTFLRDYFFTWISDHWAMAWAISGHFYLSEKLEVSLSVFCQIIRKYENLHTFGYCQLILCCFSFNNLCCNQGKVKWKLRNCCSFQTAPPATKVTKLLHVPTEVYSWHDMQKWLSSADRRLATFDRAFDITRDATGMYTGG